MLRKKVAAWTALTRRAVASLRTPSNPNRAMSTAPIRAPRPDLSVHHSPFHRFVLLPAAVSSRGYARMAHRIPPVQTNPEEDGDSESEKEEKDLFLADQEGKEEEEEEEEGEESEEWEGFVVDFGSDRKDKDEREDEQDS